MQEETPFKQVGVRDFQRNMYTYLKGIANMPVILTKNNRPKFAVITFREFERLTSSPQSVPVPQIEIINPTSELPPIAPEWDNGTPITVPKVSDINPTLLQRIWKALNHKLF